MMTNYINIFLHIDQYLLMLLQHFGIWTYVILFGIIFCECGIILTPFLPGESLLFAIGALSARGALHVGIISVTLVMAAILGGIINYYIGLYVGKNLVEGSSSKKFQKYLQRTHVFYERHGGAAVVFARFIPIIRTYVPFVAGIAKMSQKLFIFYNIAGALIWILSFISLSYFFGSIPAVKENFSLVIIAIICLSIVPVAFEAIKIYRGKDE